MRPVRHKHLLQGVEPDNFNEEIFLSNSYN
jgi:hypothetical protein